MVWLNVAWLNLDWLYESAMTPVMIGVLLVAAFGFFGYALQNRNLFWAASICAALTISAVVVERMVETDREKLHASVYGMARCVRDNDFDGLMMYAATDGGDPLSNVRAQLEAEIPKCNFRSCRIVGVRDISIDEEDSRKAKIDFVAFVNVDASATQYRYDGTVHRRVILSMRKEHDGLWRITSFSHMHPQGGQTYTFGTQ